MKVKILIPFIDKHTRKEYKKNEVVDFTPQRINEFLGADRGGFIRLVVNDTTAAEPAAKKEVKEVKENNENK